VRRPCAEVPAKYRCRMAVAASHLSHRSRQEGARQTTRSTGHINHQSSISIPPSSLPHRWQIDGSRDTAHGKLRKARRHESTLFFFFFRTTEHRGDQTRWGPGAGFKPSRASAREKEKKGKKETNAHDSHICCFHFYFIARSPIPQLRISCPFYQLLHPLGLSAPSIVTLSSSIVQLWY